MTKSNEVNGKNLENLSVVELKDMIKDNAKESGATLPAGMWKMNKAQLIIELKNIFPAGSEANDQDQDPIIIEKEIVEENDGKDIKEEVKELVKDLVEEVIEEKVEEIVEEKVSEKTEKKNTRRGKVVLLTLPSGEELEIQGMGKYHQYFKDNHPELKSWSILGAAVRGEENEKTKLLTDAGFKVKLAEGYEYGHKNQYAK